MGPFIRPTTWGTHLLESGTYKGPLLRYYDIVAVASFATRPDVCVGEICVPLPARSVNKLNVSFLMCLSLWPLLRNEPN